MKIHKLNKTNLIFLFLIWFGITLWTIFQYDGSFFSLSYGHPLQTIDNFSNDKINKGNSVAGQFTAKRDNLGTVNINFTLGQRVAYAKEDRLIFRIKEVGSQKWYYENIYRSGIIYDTPFFPFGFPIIENSKNKSFRFELISLKGNEDNAIALRRGFPTFESRYIVNRRDVLADPISFLEFFSAKFLSKILTLEVVYVSFISILPMIIYILWVTLFFEISSKYVERHPKLKKCLLNIEKSYIEDHEVMQESYFFILGASLVLLVLIDLVFIHVRANLIYLIVILMWLRSFKNNKIADLYSGIIALMFLVFSPLLLGIGYHESALKSAAWSLIFFFCSVVFVFINKKFDKK